MKIKYLFGVLCLSLLYCGAVKAEDDFSEYFKIMKEVGSTLKHDIGISISEISLLIHEGESIFQPKWALEISGEMLLLTNLEKNGFIKLYLSRGLPNGGSPDEEFVRYKATDKGLMVIAAVQSSERARDNLNKSD